ncbi:OmpA family protein [candidate division TA06 bacterium]|nr:OmpA family protein [candidate division TA06 bacterium]
MKRYGFDPRRGIILAGLSLLLLSGGTGCILLKESKYDALLQRQSELEEEVEAAKARNRGLIQRVGKLEGEVEYMKDSVGELKVEKKEEIKRLSSTYEDLVNELKKEIEEGEIEITEMKGLLKLSVLDRVFFDSGKTKIKVQGKKILARVGRILMKVRDKEIRIGGHTDDVPIGYRLVQKFPTNWELSVTRATEVARFLQEVVGIEPERLAPSGYSKFRPVASNKTEEGRQRNRRIEIILAPMNEELLGMSQ